jgi:hypothetical protein
MVADGSTHPIVASGNLLGHPSIHADLVPTFTQNLIGVSPILDKRAVGLITHDKMMLLNSDPYVDNLVNFVIKYSEQNNLIILTGEKSNGLYTTPLCTSQNKALLSIHSHHFNNMHDMVYYFYIVFNCPHVEAFCKIVSSNQMSGLPKSLTPSIIRKYYPHHDPIKAKAQLSKRPIHVVTEKTYSITYCGEQVELDILMISTSTSLIPRANGGYRHVVLAVDVYSSFLTYVPIKSMKKPQRFVEAVVLQ